MKKTLLFLSLICCALVSAKGHFYEIKSVNGVPLVHQDGQPMSARIFMGQYVEGMWMERGCKPVPQEVIMAHQAGVDTVMMTLSTIWNDKDEQQVVERLKKIQLGIITQNKDVRFIIRLNTSAPLWWKKLHPEAAARLQDGTIPDWLPANRLNRTTESGKTPFQMESPSSRTYRQGAGEALARTVRACEKYLGDHMMGYLILSQMTGEMQYFSGYTKTLDGYDDEAVRGFREFLRHRYGTVDALHKAWGRQTVDQPRLGEKAPGTGEPLTFDNAPIPSAERRNGDGSHLLRCPAEEQDVIDMEEYHSDAMSGMLLHFAKSVKSAQPGRFVGFFYGYIATMTHSFHGGGGQMAHLYIRKVLESKDIDFLSAPFDYTSRFVPGAGTMQGVPESVLLAGKLWFNEDDTSTHIAKALGDRSAGWDSAEPTAEGTIIMLRRNLIATSIRNCGVWWMDLHGLGWFLDPTLWTEMAARQELDAAVTANPVPFEPEQAVVFDTRSIWHSVGRHPRFFAYSSVGNSAQKSMALSGASYGTYLQEDVLEGRAPKLKYVIFPTTCAMTSAQRKKLRDYAKTHGTMFAWAPGYINLDTGKFDLNAVTEATGFKVRMVDGTKLNDHITVTKEGKAFGLTAPKYPAFPGERRLEDGEKAVAWPILAAVPEKQDQVLLRFSDGSPAAVYRPSANHAPSVFFSGSRIPDELIRRVGELSGVHYMGPLNSAVYENGPFSAIYAPAAGTYTITMREKDTYIDTITKRLYGPGNSFTVKMKRGQSIILKKKAQ